MAMEVVFPPVACLKAVNDMLGKSGAQYFCRVAGDNGVGLYVLGDHRAGGDDTAPPDGDRARCSDGDPGADPDVVLDDGGRCFLGEVQSGGVVGKVGRKDVFVGEWGAADPVGGMSAQADQGFFGDGAVAPDGDVGEGAISDQVGVSSYPAIDQDDIGEDPYRPFEDERAGDFSGEFGIGPQAMGFERFGKRCIRHFESAVFQVKGRCSSRI